jgi:hypothetical protein
VDVIRQVWASPRALALVALVFVSLVAAAPQARGAIPQGNLLVNGDGEVGVAVSDETSFACPFGWTCTPPGPFGGSGAATLVRYGTTALPSVGESARIGGGDNFFAGGPGNTRSAISQHVDLGVAAGEIDAGGVQAVVGGCLGGWQTQDDYALISVTIPPPPDADRLPPIPALHGPRAAERANQTKLLPVSEAISVPTGSRSIQLTLTFEGVEGGYNDGYADNLSLTLGPAPGPPPPSPPCSVPGGGPGKGGSGKGGPGGGGRGEGGPDGGGAPGAITRVLSFGKSVLVGSDGTARVPVRCNTRQVSRCKGRLSVSLVRAGQSSAQKRRKVKPGSARYSIPSLKKRTVKVPLRKADANAVARLSAGQLARRRLKLKATTTVGSAKLKQTSLVALRRRR